MSIDIAFKKFTEEIKFEISKSFEKVMLKEAYLNPNSNIFSLEFHANEIIPLDEFVEFSNSVNANFRYKAKLKFKINSPVFSPEIVKGYMSWIADRILGDKSTSKILQHCDFLVKDNNVSIYLEQMYAKSKLEKNKALLEKVFHAFGFAGIKFDFILSEVDMEEFKKEYDNKLETTFSGRTNSAKEVKHIATKAKKWGYKFFKIKDIADSQFKKVITEGEIFKIEIVKTKTKFTIIKYSITDYEDAINVKAFAKDESQLSDYTKYQVGDFVSIHGNYEIDAYSGNRNEPVINLSKIIKIDKKSKVIEDNAPIKRVELNLRSKMSTMDGLVDVKQLIKRVEQLGHSAVAINDYNSLQAFPDFYNNSKGSTFKPIFGATINIMHKQQNYIFNPDDSNLDFGKYVIFDLETTGLSPVDDDIIEFGAVKVENNKVVEKKQFFINTKKTLKPFIVQLTNITNDMLKNAVSEEVGMSEIKDYIKGYTLVAHNASFDLGFLKEKFAKYNIGELTNPVIDTLAIARMILASSKKFRLGYVAKKFKVNYDQTVAHRADYDAEILSYVWIKMLPHLVEKGLITQKDLFVHIEDHVFEKMRPTTATILAKNQAGLKELFEIISLNKTETFYKKPISFWDDIKKYKNILIGSGSLRSKLVDLMLYGTIQDLEDEIDNYDYIEIQPIRNFVHKKNDFELDLVAEKIRHIVKVAMKKKKIVVATGDVRYLNERDKIFHSVLVDAKGLGGIRHYLFNYGNPNAELPKQNFLSTNQMKDEMQFLGNEKLIHDVVVTNTNLIADMISKVQVIKDKLYSPKMEGVDKKLKDLVYKNANSKYGQDLPDIIKNRIEKELSPIIEHGYHVIYWISHLLVKKSLDDGYVVGSRGSVGSSLVATFSEITEVNPLPPHYVCTQCQANEFFENSELNSGFDLPKKNCPHCNIEYERNGQNIPFETFLGFNANKVPDIDLNFSGVYQPTIHNHVKELFGDKHSFRAGTISTVAERTAFGYVKNWAEGHEINVSNSFIEFIAKNIVGVKRTTGQHPGGIIVIPKEYSVEDFTPINFPANDVESSWKTTHFDFHAIHDNVLKLDLLGHDDPTAIKQLENMTGIKPTEIEMTDEKVMSLFSSTKALGIKPEDIGGEQTGAMGIPEFGTSFVRGMLKKANPKSFGDLISISGLSHGTDVWANNAEILVKEGKPLNSIVSCRDDIMVGLMAKDVEPLTSFEIMEKVRKGKGITPEQEQLLKDKGIEDWFIDSLKKIKYMFPKAHATAYVMMAWRIAWFKVYYPLEYYATYFTTRADVFDLETIGKGKIEITNKIKFIGANLYRRGTVITNKEISLLPIYELALEAMARNIKFSKVDVLKSEADRWIIDKEANLLIPPFTSIDGLGISVAKSIITARNNSSFSSIEDFKNRTTVNKTSLEKLRNFGALDEMDETNQIALDI